MLTSAIQAQTSGCLPVPNKSIDTINIFYSHAFKTQSIVCRIKSLSQQFLGKPYRLDPLGEGYRGQYNDNPLFRLDSFDCLTYVETLTALAIAHNSTTFKQCLNAIRYKHGKVDYLSRNHFINIDWNKNNYQQGLIIDITHSFRDINQQPVALTVETIIDKARWYQYKSLKAIKLSTIPAHIKSQRLAQLKQLTHNLDKQVSRLTYLPVSALFDKQKKPNYFLFAQIPDGAIIEIARPKWNLISIIGTQLDISHLGFAFWRNHKLVFNQASSLENKVIEYSLIDYLKNTLENTSIKGIVVLKINPQATSLNCSE